ncbi:thiamine pyrophosphate-dependent enzyme [Nocardioides humi]|uniref:thiamine pyrophosphate-dependent enzyme n=1 Tax=Nocardioides humi TaxID=449461 RepID=UPI00319EB1DF
MQRPPKTRETTTDEAHRSTAPHLDPHGRRRVRRLRDPGTHRHRLRAGRRRRRRVVHPPARPTRGDRDVRGRRLPPDQWPADGAVHPRLPRGGQRPHWCRQRLCRLLEHALGHRQHRVRGDRARRLPGAVPAGQRRPDPVDPTRGEAGLAAAHGRRPRAQRARRAQGGDHWPTGACGAQCLAGDLVGGDRGLAAPEHPWLPQGRSASSRRVERGVRRTGAARGRAAARAGRQRRQPGAGARRTASPRRAAGCPGRDDRYRQGAFPEDHPLSVGVLGWVGTGTANEAARSADVILVLGARLAETTASSWVPGATFTPGTRLIHADAELSGVANAYPVAEVLIGDLAATLDDLAAALGDASAPELDGWLAHLDQARTAWSTVVRRSRAPGRFGAIGTGAVVQALRTAYPGPLNMVNDCGKHHKWVVQQLQAREDDQIISSMGGASMGIGLAGAIGAALARPEAPTIAWLGDGGLAMSLAALPTVAEYRLPVLTVVIDDASYGVVHNTQMAAAGRSAFADFDGSGTHPDYRLDFTAVAQGCGIPARTVADPAELDAAFAWAKAQDGPAVLTVLSDKGSVQPSGGGQLRPLEDNSRRLVWS